MRSDADAAAMLLQSALESFAECSNTADIRAAKQMLQSL
jgi:hypothetical protein